MTSSPSKGHAYYYPSLLTWLSLLAKFTATYITSVITAAAKDKANKDATAANIETLMALPECQISQRTKKASTYTSCLTDLCLIPGSSANLSCASHRRLLSAKGLCQPPRLNHWPQTQLPGLPNRPVARISPHGGRQDHLQRVQASWRGQSRPCHFPVHRCDYRQVLRNCYALHLDRPWSVHLLQQRLGAEVLSKSCELARIVTGARMVGLGHDSQKEVALLGTRQLFL